MKRLVLVLAVLALVVAPAASAHSYYHNKPGLASKLEGRIVAFRVKHGSPWTFPGFANVAATIALQKANYHEHKWTLKIGGDPYGVWAVQFFPPPNFSVMMTSIRPHGAPWTPYQVMKRWKKKDVYRAALLYEGWTKIAVRAGDVHQHKGDYKGKGKCRVYYVSMSTSIANPRPQ